MIVVPRAPFVLAPTEDGAEWISLDAMPPGSWNRVVVPRFDPEWPRWYARGGFELSGERGAFVYHRCPSGHVLQVSRAVHAIAADGTCSPSFVCATRGCSFHEHVRLEGWEP